VASTLLVVTLPLFTYAGVLAGAGAIATLCFRGSRQGLGLSFRYWGAVLSAAFGRRHDRGITVVR